MTDFAGGMATDEGQAGRRHEGRMADDPCTGLSLLADRWDAQEPVCWSQWASIGGTMEVSAVGMTTEAVVQCVLSFGPQSGECLLTRGR
jgi:hypothetical protein